MLESGLAGIPQRLWRDAQAASQRLLMLDYDGTLAPFCVERRAARPLPGCVERLRAIAAGGTTRLVVISGRPIETLEALLGPLPATLIGEHGWEERVPGGEIVREPLPEIARLALERAADTTSSREWGARVERKRTALVLHTRGLEPAAAARIESECDKLCAFADMAGLQRRSIHGGIELRARGHDKGTAVQRLIRRSPLRPLAIYLGDDETDEDAFAVVAADGYGIRVGPVSNPSCATGRLPSWDAVPEFLDTWARVVERLEH
jgi:trehalose-phosphatase